MPEVPMLDVSDLTVEIQGSRILSGINLQVNAGELVCLIGRNGAGKSTTFRALMGQRPAVAGSIRFMGRDIGALPTYKIARAGIGYAPEESEVFADLTVAENIEMPTWISDQGGRKLRSPADRIAFAYEVFPKLDGYKARGGGQLSGGERKMLSIARALAVDPELLLLDEPFEGLSPTVIPQISEGLASIRKSGRALLVAESQFHHVPASADRLYVIERGEIIFSGTIAEARRQPAIMAVLEGVK